MRSNRDAGVITTALLLAAGKGSRLYPLTRNTPKCLTMVHEASILERLIINLKKQGFKRLVVVTGYQEKCIREFLGTQAGGMKIEYIFSPLYETTNNIYSLWMARKIINEPFLLIESDLVFDVSLLDDMCFPDRIAVARMQPWMNGSTVTVNKSQHVKRFQCGTVRPFDEIRYKTVNIYSFSLSSWHSIAKRLDQYISAGRVNDYYETVFAEMVVDGSLSLKTVSFDSKRWYEIDTVKDLAEAEKLFSADKSETIIPNNIMPYTSGISRPHFQQTKRREKETITRSISGLRSFPPSNYLNLKPILEAKTPKTEVPPKNK
ncbi:MAG: phosphocholine cytidylyltransferase family protein [Methanosarcina sp.]|uniref:phosphocholine cytidylyltransferase family protein n=1 Tax=Methanosarcina sp. TaxID=2213 RepID=UPI00260EA611|nr:phosphocholine cytidylyltransferase family protein [Methanosarcina sp.]MDD3245734.1 phosphocholine cytidylyltransferase family protein [Methanosarcina sp.]